MKRGVIGKGVEITVRATLVLVILAAFVHSAFAVNGSITAQNNQGDVAFVESDNPQTENSCSGEECDGGISLKVRRGGADTRIATNGDVFPQECFGGTNSGNACTNDNDCPGGGTCRAGVLSGFAKRVCINDSGVVVARVGIDYTPATTTCPRFGTNAGEPCSSDADCGGQDCRLRDDDQGAAVITDGIGQPQTVIARTCDEVGSDVITCPDPAADINNAGQVGFSAAISTDQNFCNNLPSAEDFCDEDDNGADDGTNIPPGWSRAIYRFTPGTGLELMLRNGDMVGSNTVQEAAQEHNDEDNEGDGDSKINAAGQMLTMARYDNGNFNDDFLDALLLLNGPGDRVEIVREEIAMNGDFSEIEKGMLNSANPTQVLYKLITGIPAGAINDSEAGEQGTEHLFLFTQGDGNEEIASEGDPVANGGTFEGFGSRFHCLNDLGQAAFVAGLNSPVLATGGGEGGADVDPQPQGLFFWDGDSLTEIARTTEAGGTGTNSFNGFEFEWFAAAVALNDAGKVCFIAENTNNSVGDNEASALFCWTRAAGIQEVFRDGDAVEGNTNTSLVPAIQTMKRTLNENGDMAFVIDPTATEDESDDNFRLVTSLGAFRRAAPVLSGVALVLVAALMVGFGVRTLRRRRSA